jgi:hypothetical protein
MARASMLAPTNPLTTNYYSLEPNFQPCQGIALPGSRPHVPIIESTWQQHTAAIYSNLPVHFFFSFLYLVKVVYKMHKQKLLSLHKIYAMVNINKFINQKKSSISILNYDSEI